MEFLFLIPAALLAYGLAGLRIIKQYERGVVFTLGKFAGTRNAGLTFVPPVVATMRKVSLRIVAIDIPAQDVITRDNISVKVNGVLYFRVADPTLAVIEIQDYMMATSQLAQTTLLSVLGQVELDELLADRKRVSNILREILDERTDFWGVEVSAVEIKDVLLPETMRRAIGRQAEAERERRAKIISAQGELQASQTLADAARVMQEHPASLQLRYLQTISEIATENNSTTIFPLPMDLLSAFTARLAGAPAATPNAAQGAISNGAPAPAALPSASEAVLPKVRVGEPVEK